MKELSTIGCGIDILPYLFYRSSEEHNWSTIYSKGQDAICLLYYHGGFVYSHEQAGEALGDRQ
jgi:hypothetical protein